MHPESPDRRSTDPLRLLCTGKFRHDVSGHGAGAQGAAALALNVPAIALLDALAPAVCRPRLKQAGGNLVLPKDEVRG